MRRFLFATLTGCALMGSADFPDDALLNVSLPAVSFVDTEVSMNVPLPNLTRANGRVVFSLGCLATATNKAKCKM